MKTITYYADDMSMGDTAREQCDAHRAWAKEKLQRLYPDHVIIVSAETSSEIAETDDEEGRDEILMNCYALWDEWNQ